MNARTRIRAFAALIATAMLSGCDAQSYLSKATDSHGMKGVSSENPIDAIKEADVNIDYDNLHDIYFAEGCFWGVEEYLSRGTAPRASASVSAEMAAASSTVLPSIQYAAAHPEAIIAKQPCAR